MDIAKLTSYVPFIIGVIVGFLLWWIISTYKKVFSLLTEYVKKQSEILAYQRGIGVEEEFRRDILLKAQEQHVANVLFSLDEIVIPPSFLSPPPRVEPGVTGLPDETQAIVIPYMPDYPDLPSVYGSNRLPIFQTIHSGEDFAIIAPPGYGKTVALAFIASAICRRDSGIEELNAKIPVLLHIHDFDTKSAVQRENSVEYLVKIIKNTYPDIEPVRFVEMLKTRFEEGNVLLLVDGLDELPAGPLSRAVEVIQAIKAASPQTQVIVSADPRSIDSLPACGFQFLPLAAWNDAEREKFYAQWGENWSKHVNSKFPIDPAIMLRWLKDKSEFLSPLETTLKLWAAYAGTSRGPRVIDAIESYLRQIIPDVQARPAFENLALQMAVAMQPAISRREAGHLMKTTVPDDDSAQASPKSPRREKLSGAAHLFPSLAEFGLLLLRANGRISFSNPVIAGYLAGQALSEANNPQVIASQPNWPGKTLALRCFAALGDPSVIVDACTQDSSDPLFRNFLVAAEWLQDSRENAPWKNQFLGRLNEMLNQDTLPLGLRARLLSALLKSNDRYTQHILKQMLASASDHARQLAVLGLGALGDLNSVNAIASLLASHNPHLRMAACLALMKIGGDQPVEAVASALLNSDDLTRRAAAEAFALNAAEGHPLLQEGTQVKNSAVRRAVVFGLQKVGDLWALEILTAMRDQEEEWLVQNAVVQAIDELEKPNPGIPRSLPAPAGTPWLIAFAGKHGLGVAGGGYSATEIFLKALKTGSEEERVAALDYLRLTPDENVIAAVYSAAYGSFGATREAAFDALCFMGASGVALPSPAQAAF